MERNIGANIINDQCVFEIWAPEKEKIALHIVSPADEIFEMQKDVQGYFRICLPGSYTGCRYYYNLDGKDYPDPTSFYQPEGVGGPSELVDHSFEWTDDSWRNIPFGEYIIYELHIGTFTGEGTFEAVIERLDDLVVLGINAIEIMPIAQFPGARNWGYDGVFPYAAQNSYGGYIGLKKLVNACHEKGIAVILDVVYNHMGPEGNCLPVFAPYFTAKYRTPWGDAINYDEEYSDGVREYFCGNALYWLKYFHIDALRLDAIHQMYDFGALHFWEYLSGELDVFNQQTGKIHYLIAESDLNNPKVVKDIEGGGYGFNAQWLDDFHHALYVLIYPKGKDRYRDFGKIDQLAKAYTDGYVHSGQFVSFRKRKFGQPSVGLPGDRFIAFIQNHDQVGNTLKGDRLSNQVDLPQLKVAAAALLLAPYIPMLFMGEEYAEDAPFTYFVDHKDPKLIEAIREGRKKEFAHENWQEEPADAKSYETFSRCKLQWETRNDGKHGELLNWYKTLIELRKSHKALKNFDRQYTRVHIISDTVFILHRISKDETEELLAVFNLSGEEQKTVMLTQYDHFRLLISSCESSDGGHFYLNIFNTPSVSLPSYSVVVYTNCQSM
ncbi:MAG: malto-oligosyltrehalose trehalohydrolase [Flavipsychrobacter sp.]